MFGTKTTVIFMFDKDANSISTSSSLSMNELNGPWTRGTSVMSTSTLHSSLLHEYTIRHGHFTKEDWGDSFTTNPLHAVKIESMTSSSLYNSISGVIVTSQD